MIKIGANLHRLCPPSLEHLSFHAMQKTKKEKRNHLKLFHFLEKALILVY
jgi:hypothetical protein